MLKQDLKSDEDEHDAAHDGGRFFVARAKGVADRYAGDGEDKRCDADKRYSGNDVDRKRGERDAHGQGVDPVSEAASAPVKPKKTAATDDDSDVDEDAAETAAPAKKETFAERRARLAAEKAASEGAAEGEGAVDEAEGTEPAAAVEPEPAAEPEPEPAEPTTADLYARRPRKRKAVVDQLARELEVEDDAAAADAPKGGDE